MTFQDFINLTEIECDATFVAYETGEWPHFSWECTLRMPGVQRALTIPYKLGVAHCKRVDKVFVKGPRVAMDRALARALKPFGRLSVDDCEGYVIPTAPQLADVLCSLQSDCASGDLSFDEFCAEFGYDSDSRKAYATWEACTSLRGRMRSLMRNHYDVFMACEE